MMIPRITVFKVLKKKKKGKDMCLNGSTYKRNRVNCKKPFYLQTSQNAAIWDSIIKLPRNTCPSINNRGISFILNNRSTERIYISRFEEIT